MYSQGKFRGVPTVALRFVRRGTLRVLQQFWAEKQVELKDLEAGTAHGQWCDIPLVEEDEPVRER